jgi:hypothetical protein
VNIKDIVLKEADEGRLLVAYLRIKGYRFTHIANETGSGRAAQFQGIRNKQQGVSKGFPDYLIVTKTGLIAIELKRTKGSTTTKEQLEWLDALNSAGVASKVCKGAQEAIEFIKEQEAA